MRATERGGIVNCPSDVMTDMAQYSERAKEATETSRPAGSQPALVFALLNGEIKHVDEVATGKPCGCVCPGCQESLIAKNNGAVMAHHFAHISGADCATGVETALHLAAKAVLMREMRIILPSQMVYATATDHKGRTHEGAAALKALEARFEKVTEELWLEGIRPDIVAFVMGKPVLIEIAVTHFADAEKLRKIEERGAHSIEVDLSSMAGEWNWERLKDALIQDSENKKWLFNPAEKRLKKIAQAEADATARKANFHIRRENEKIQRGRIDTPGFTAALAALSQCQDPLWVESERTKLAREPQTGLWTSASRSLRIVWERPPEHVNIPVEGELGILADRRVWQAAMFAWFIKENSGKSFSARQAAQWCIDNFPLRPGFQVLQKHRSLLTPEEKAILPYGGGAAFRYLEELERRGFIKSQGNRYLILKRFDASLAWHD